MQYTVDQEGSHQVVNFSHGVWSGKVMLTHGANLIRLQHEKYGAILRTPPDEETMSRIPEAWGIPVLLPPNRIKDGAFSFDGRSYHFPINDLFKKHHIHGIVARRVWSLKDSDDHSLIFCFENTPELDCYEWFPHTFTVELKYVFNDQSIDQQVRVANTSAQRMPFGFGFHTAFVVEDESVIQATTENFQWINDDKFFPNGEKSTLPPEFNFAQGVKCQGQWIACHTPVTTDSSGFRGARITMPEKGFTLVYRIDETFKQWMFWNGMKRADQNFFCPEPQTWITNAPNSMLPPEISGMQGIEAGESWACANQITIED